jgi:hypothetical protein
MSQETNQPAIEPSLAPAEERPKESKQLCMVCGSYVARTFVDMGTKRIHLCQQDAATILRMIFKLEPTAAHSTLVFVYEQIYGKECDV